jgi:hypothetical protein
MVDEKQKQNPNNTEIPATRENLFPFIDPDSYQSKELYEAARDEYLKSQPVKVPPYETLENKGKYGSNEIRFKNGILENVVASFGKVSFENQTDGNIKLFYEYDANVEKSLHPFNVEIPESKQLLERHLGDFLMACIEEQARNKTILFRGGSEEMEAYTKKTKTDENRNNNT